MHNVNDPRWTDDRHEDFFKGNSASCKVCHGPTLRGTALSNRVRLRDFRWRTSSSTLRRERRYACDICHGIPDDDD